MPLTHRVNTTYFTDAGAIVQATQSYSADGEVNFDGVAAADGTTEIAVAFNVADVEAFLLHSTQDVTLKTNDADAPDDTITLSAGKPIVWTSGDVFDNPFTENVSSMFVVNAHETLAATVKIRVLTDVTPTP